MREIKLKFTPKDIEVKAEELDEAIRNDLELRPIIEVAPAKATTAREKALANHPARAQIELNRRKVMEWEGELINGVDLYNHPNFSLRQQYRNIIDGDGKIYLIMEGEKVVVIQPFKPSVPGFQLMKTEQDLEDTANSHIKDIVHSNLFSRAFSEAREEMLK